MKFLSIVFMMFALTACQKISTGHVGIRTTFNGTIEPQELGVGFHQTLIGSVKNYVANEITWKLDDLHPQTKDRSSLNDLDISYNYSINPSSIGDLVVKYKGRDYLDKETGDYYPLAFYVENVVKTATTDVFSRYDALDANQNREKIRDEIKLQAEAMFKEDGLSESVDIHQVFIKNLQLSQAIMDSANAVIISQNVLKTKEYEVQTAKKENERLTLLSSNKANLDYIKVNALEKIADGVKEGKVRSIIIPADFKGLLNVGD
jgi:SPFH domain / Band 7 family